jgi:hypothetical protein
MPVIAKIVLLADKIEVRKRNRRPVMKGIRRAARHDLDIALLCWSDWMWVEEREQGWLMHPDHWLARSAWVGEHHADRRALTPRTLRRRRGRPPLPTSRARGSVHIRR